MTIDVFSQEKFDAIPDDFWGTIFIRFGTLQERAVVNRSMRHATVVATRFTYVEAQRNSYVIAQAHSTVIATECSIVVAESGSNVFARDKSMVRAKIGSDICIVDGEPHVVLMKNEESKEK